MLTTEQRELRTVVRDLLARESPESTVREVMAADGVDTALWKRMAGDLGLHGLAIPEQYGGMGASWVEQGIVLEELGRSLACVPYLSTLMAQAALLAGAPEARERWLPGLADGSLTATVAVTAASLEGGALTGRLPYVLDGATADLVLVVADDSLWAVESPQAEAVQTSDLTRRVAHLVLDRAAATRVGGAEALAAARRVGVTLLACEQTGGVSFCLDQAVAYAKTREQFGVAIGSFQAVKHRLADMLVLAESARSAAYEALARLDAADDVVWRIAGAVCGDAYAVVASSNVQVHGGIGFTWEHSAQLHVKRSRGSSVLLGTPAQHRHALGPYVLVGA